MCIWITGYGGVNGNEKADQEAFKAATSIIDTLNPNLKYVCGPKETNTKCCRCKNIWKYQTPN